MSGTQAVDKITKVKLLLYEDPYNKISVLGLFNYSAFINPTCVHV